MDVLNDMHNVKLSFSQSLSRNVVHLFITISHYIEEEKLVVMWPIH